MRSALAITTFGLLLLSSCTSRYNPEYTQTVINEQFALDIPVSMEPSNELHDFAALQVADEKHGFFLIGIAEPKEDLENLQLHYGLDDYADFVQRTVGGGMDTANVATTHSQTVNGLSCISADMFGAISTEEEPLEIFYRVTVLESAKWFYQLIGWSSREDFLLFRSVANHIECSFAEISIADSELPTIEDDGTSGAAAESNR